MAERRPGPLRLLLAAYALLGLAAGARATVQLATRAHEAPLAYGLSAVAAVVYLVAGAALATRDARGRRIALAACTVELAGVLTVGTASVLVTGAFPDDSVWSRYGAGYGWLPTVLPVAGLLWLRGPGARGRPATDARRSSPGPCRRRRTSSPGRSCRRASRGR